MVRPAYWGAPLLGVCISMLVLDWVCVALRMMARRRIHAFGVDDWLMCAGLVRRVLSSCPQAFLGSVCVLTWAIRLAQVIFTIFVGLMIEICFLGAGYPSRLLTADELYRGIKVGHAVLVLRLPSFRLTLPS